MSVMTLASGGLFEARGGGILIISDAARIGSMTGSPWSPRAV